VFGEKMFFIQTEELSGLLLLGKSFTFADAKITLLMNSPIEEIKKAVAENRTTPARRADGSAFRRMTNGK